LKRAHGGEIRLFCAHDVKELEAFPSIVAEPIPAETAPLSQHA
jgi:hypothetical protein